MPGGIGLANPQFPYKSYFDPIGEAAPSSYTYDVTTKNQFALRSFKDDDGNCFTDMVLMSDGADSTSTFRLFTNTPEGNAVERMAVTNTVLATTSLTSASLTVSENASVSNVTQTTPVLFKISLQSANDLNDSTTYTIRNLFGSGSIQKFNNGVFTYTDNTITVPSNGYYRVTMNFKWDGNDNLSIGVQPVISGADSGEIFSGFEGNRANNADPCISSSSIYNLTGNRQIGFKFAKLGSNGTATREGSASFVRIEKL